jgi:hypothetical protein
MERGVRFPVGAWYLVKTKPADYKYKTTRKGEQAERMSGNGIPNRMLKLQTGRKKSWTPKEKME